jgi:hypothetical protein
LFVTPTAASQFIEAMFASERQQQKQKDTTLYFDVQQPVAQPSSSDGSYGSSVSYSDAYLSNPVCQDGLAGAFAPCRSPSELQSQSQELQVPLICNWSLICVQLVNSLLHAQNHLVFVSVGSP